MTFEDRVNAVADFGFTQRQARFLVTVMLHSGACLTRQYTAFAGIAYGQKTSNFFHKLVSRRYATVYPCRHNRGLVYHVRYKALYRAIGETDNRHRRPLSAASVVEGLMLLDAVFASPGLVWLATEEEKRTHLSILTGIPLEQLPHMTTGEGPARTVQFFPDKVPIGIDLSGRWVLVYLATSAALEEFHGFLQRHADLLRTLPAWTLRLVLPPDLKTLDKPYQQVVKQELMSPLEKRLLDELKWYFNQRRASGGNRAAVTDEERFAYAKAAFSAPRYRVLYPRWLKEGEVALEAVSCKSIADAITRGAGRVESIVLPHQYRHLSPLVLGGDLRRVPEHTRRQVNEIKQTPDEMGAPS